MTKIVIATRQSALALWQANFIRDRLLAAHSDLQVELLGIATKGDQWLSSPLSDIGGKGLFIKELEQAMLAGEAHVAVHSMKDAPAQLPAGFGLPFIGFREDARDVLVTQNNLPLAQLPAGARIGSSSLRRQSQLLAQRPDLQISSIRGNVGTRLQKLVDGEFDGIVLAAAGLNRLGLENRVSEYLPVETCLPAAGQGALGIECLLDDSHTQALIANLAEVSVDPCVVAERAVTRALDATCTTPLGAYAQPTDAGMHLRGLLASADGQTILTAEAMGADPELLGAQVAEQLNSQGAQKLLQALAG